MNHSPKEKFDILWYIHYYDYPRSGIGFYKGEKVYFSLEGGDELIYLTRENANDLSEILEIPLNILHEIFDLLDKEKAEDGRKRHDEIASKIWESRSEILKGTLEKFYQLYQVIIDYQAYLCNKIYTILARNNLCDVIEKDDIQINLHNGLRLVLNRCNELFCVPPLTYNLYRMSPKALEEKEIRHKDFQKYVGYYTDRGENYKPYVEDGTSHLYYDKYKNYVPKYPVETYELIAEKVECKQ